MTRDEAEYILTYKPDGTFLVWEMSGEPVTDPSSLSIITHGISVVLVDHGNWCLLFVQC